jgi:protein-S-isoprenylcysteine O-methyltransferase Ste14
MSSQQISGVVVFLLGVAALMVSVGVAWTVTRITRTRPVEGAWLLTLAGVLLLLVGLALCYFGVSTLVGGSA